jgi:hypothetical protein
MLSNNNFPRFSFDFTQIPEVLLSQTVFYGSWPRLSAFSFFSCRSKHKKLRFACVVIIFALMLDLMSEFLSPSPPSTRHAPHADIPDENHLPKSSFNFSFDNYLFTKNAHVQCARDPSKHV